MRKWSKIKQKGRQMHKIVQSFAKQKNCEKDIKT